MENLEHLPVRPVVAIAGNVRVDPGLGRPLPLELSHPAEEAVVQDGYMNALTDGYGEVPA